MSAEGGAPMGENPFDCRSDQAIATGFMDLPEAVAIAHGRGMKAELPKRAGLQNRTSGVPGEDIFGVTWQIFSTDRRDQSYLIPTEPQAAATVRVVDPCRLITTQDAEYALGAAVHRVPPHYDEPHTWSCIYQVGDDQRQRLSLKMDENPAVNSRGYMANRRKSVPDLGDEAYVFDSPAGFATLDVRLGDTLLKFGLGNPDSGREQTITALAQQAVGRMVAGEGILAEALPDAKLTGEWTATHDNRKLLLIVRPDKALTLSVAESKKGVLRTDPDRWEVLDRERRPQKAGTWEWSGPDEFRTSGNVIAAWRRVPDGSRPGNIPPSLTAGTGIDRVGSTESGPWPQMPLDGKLAGLWLGEGQIGRQDVDLAWRIRPEGPSTLIWTATGKGYVENVDRSQRIILKFSGELEKIARQAKLDLHDGAVVTGFPDDNRMVMQLHDLKQLGWTRVGTDPVSTLEVPDSVPSPGVGRTAETARPPEPSPPPDPRTSQAGPVPPVSGTASQEADQGSGAGGESVREKAAKVGRKTVDIVDDAAETVGDFIEGIFGGKSSTGREPDKSRPAGQEFEPTDW
ncbi:MAG: hypothetical protein U9R74_09060 [Pseudomonadota bacterium]|nr:hypothetical protein [Pseudomonadota bacterium]